MYRSRMGGGKPNSKILNYLSSADADSEIIIYDILGSQAHVLMLLHVGLLSRTSARRILCALQDMLDNKNRDMYGNNNNNNNNNNDQNNNQKKDYIAYAKTTTTEDIHELVESIIIKKIGMEHGGRMHTSRSRNDQIALDIRMKLRDDINTMCRCILDMAESMISLANEHKRTIMPLYTHMQQAQPGILSHWLLAHTDALLRDYDRLSDTFTRVNKSPLGSGPVGGTSLKIDRDYTAQLLGFDGLVENSLDATSTRDFAAEYASSVSIMMSNLSRLAEDVVIWSTSEFSFVALEDGLASPSSAMPQKKNPDILEITRAKAAQVSGNLCAILGMVNGLASGYGRDLQQVKPILWSISDIGVSTLSVLQAVFGNHDNNGLQSGIRINKARMRKAANSDDLVALDLAEHLVFKYNVPFRVAHGVAAALVQYVHVAKRSISKLDISEIQKVIDLNHNKTKKMPSAKEIHTITSSLLDASSSLQNRISRGSSGYAEQKRMINDRKETIIALGDQLNQRIKKINDAFDLLQKQIRDV